MFVIRAMTISTNRKEKEKEKRLNKATPPKKKTERFAIHYICPLKTDR